MGLVSSCCQDVKQDSLRMATNHDEDKGVVENEEGNLNLTFIIGQPDIKPPNSNKFRRGNSKDSQQSLVKKNSIASTNNEVVSKAEVTAQEPVRKRRSSKSLKEVPPINPPVQKQASMASRTSSKGRVSAQAGFDKQASMRGAEEPNPIEELPQPMEDISDYQENPFEKDVSLLVSYYNNS